MLGLTIAHGTTVKGIRIEEFEGGRRFCQERDAGATFGTVFGIAFGLVWVALGLAMPFLSQATAPGLGFVLKAAIGVFLVLFGGFIISAVWRNLSGVLEVDLANACLRHFTVDRNNKRHGLRKIGFDAVRGIFTEAETSDETPAKRSESLIITYQGRPGRLHALSSSSGQIAMVRDYILKEALQQQAPPVVNGLAAFARRAKWEFQQRAK